MTCGITLTSLRPSLVVRPPNCGRITLAPAAARLVLLSRGQPGPDGQTALYTYGETISALQPVIVQDGELFVADSDNADHRGRVIGLAITAGTVGQSGRVRYLGRIQDAVWNWTGAQLFVGPGGTLVQTPPSGFSQPIAIVESADTIFVNPLNLIERA